MKLIKNNITIWLIASFVGISSFSSCVDEIKFGDGFLEKDPGVDVNIDSIFSKGENAKAFLWNLYSNINAPLTTLGQLVQAPVEILADTHHGYIDWANNYYPGTVSPDIGSRDKCNWISSTNRPSPWEAIRKGWILIENLDRVPDLSDTEKSQLKGETYVIMASRFFDLYRNYGGLPLIEKAYAPGEAYERGRATTKETYAFIDSLLTCAISESGLTWEVADRTNWSGRITKASAMALRAQVAVFHASPLFNADAMYMPSTSTDENWKDEHVWHGGYDASLWNTALQHCKAFFDTNASNGGFYALVQSAGNSEKDYAKAFRTAYWNRGTSEKIFELTTDYWADAGSFNWGWPNDMTSLVATSHQGTFVPTLDYMEMFPLADGKPYTYQSIYGTNNPDNIDIFANRDPRMYETMLVCKEELIEDFMDVKQFQFWVGGDSDDVTSVFRGTASAAGGERYMSGVAPFKWCLDVHQKPILEPFSYGVIRMADMHLMYAECLAQTGNLTGACSEVNKVRARVGLGNIQTCNPGLQLTQNKDNLIQEILRERACELGLEDSRLYDIIRYKMENKFNTALRELKTYRKDKNGQKMLPVDGGSTKLEAGESWPNFIYEASPITYVTRAWWLSGWSKKYFLSPVPRDEVKKGYGMTQNPGW